MSCPFARLSRGCISTLFPRTAWLLKEYFKANDCANDPVNGPMLFEWARGTFGPGSHVPKGNPDLKSACGILRESSEIE